MDNQIETWKREIRVIKQDLWNSVRTLVTGQLDREQISDLLRAYMNRNNKIIFKYEDMLKSKEGK